MKTLKMMLALGLLCLSSATVQAVEIRAYHQDVIGKDCKACHDNGIKQFPSDQACQQCHDVDELAETTARSEEDKWQNPHNNLHYGKELPCQECHGEHKAKEPICRDCHTFKYDKHKK
ncbi:cytochrome c3 family protein [Shewanella sp. 1_MG-2023]|uniref:cytochrome c3 family protein n=1 Tax=unclassified Shewanella TaxID=196818 RepID=UPI0026E31777|nr:MULTISPECIES: cytochrome c3 family protein [unclassified Shewanella]MDO6613225.1 cytochrome c3 family protein [Shewanella sp. 7_MG-2023]MDO6773103.1 cytochrome c3 family protein [Shewanella sp. 2_MG-2023]MDO6795579.1 cytochrome c3 family protein [Shewanella sp. 1_MG-2023]